MNGVSLQTGWSGKASLRWHCSWDVPVMDTAWGRSVHEHWAHRSQCRDLLGRLEKGRKGQWGRSPEREEGGYRNSNGELVCISCHSELFLDKLRPRKVKWCAQGITENGWQLLGLEPGSLTWVFNASLCCCCCCFTNYSLGGYNLCTRKFLHWGQLDDF